MAAAVPTSTDEALPLVDIGLFAATGDDAAACAAVAAALARYSAVIIRDARVTPASSATFLDMMEAYFGQPRAVKMADARPDLAYQVGVTPNGIEVPRDVAPFVASLADASQHPAVAAVDGDGDGGGGGGCEKPPRPAADPKWRFLFRIGERPSASATAFPELNAPPVTPAAFADRWDAVMTQWGTQLLAAVTTVAAMLSVGLGQPADAIPVLMADAPHLLGPTGADMDLHGEAVGRVLAGAHYDLNLLTIHGGARLPGLRIWDRDGRRLAVRVPPGCLLVQAGRQVEHLTGGRVRRGMHEVVVTPATVAAVRAKRAAAAAAADGATADGDRKGQGASPPPVWRVSSTLFAHVASDAVVAPLGDVVEGEAAYPPMRAGDMVAEELRAINLAAS